MGDDTFPGNTPTSSNIDGDLENCPKCGRAPVCGGLGVIRYDVPIEDPRFGKFFRCPNNPLEQDVEHQERLRRLSNLGAYADKTFQNFTTEIAGLTSAEYQSLERAYRGAQNYAVQLEGWFLLEGNYGSGKTHLAAAIGNARIARGDVVLFITTPDLLDHLRNTYSPASDMAYDEMFERVRNVRLLILDDLGAENPSSWALEKLFQLLNHRYSQRMATIITTNANLDRLDPRIRSRLLDESLVNRQTIIAPDYRLSSLPNPYQQLSNLSLYQGMIFENFDTQRKTTPGERVNLDKVLAAAQSYANKPQGWLILTGSYGSGKTHLAAAIGHHQEELRTKVMFVTVPDLLDHLRLTYSPDASVSFDQQFQMVRNAPLLILDDLGTENATSWAKEKLFQILDYRYVTGLPTVITTAPPTSGCSATRRPNTRSSITTRRRSRPG